ncbi:hypothetical protein HF086_006218 [Spodoptera exigua]|uniref:Uncharacterized protein n=1 Tax=Spodoptera exigua TaxID=7107 RepID=A0A922SF15_SPOEX|nr:hypothetical protein HF086_006218 [Spodoptera exigua]
MYSNTVAKMSDLLTNVHETAGISKDSGKTYLVSGNYKYYHYLCDGFDDRDPHYVGKEQTKEFLFHKGWVKWQQLTDFIDTSFYNLCLPQVKAKCK